MTRKPKKANRKKPRARPARIRQLHASIEDDLQALMEPGAGVESRWNRPRRQRVCLRVDIEVLDWFKGKGPGYQTRINGVLRRVMEEGKKREK
jgi:uncharacterized protein (DUF4415 family)